MSKIGLNNARSGKVTFMRDMLERRSSLKFRILIKESLSACFWLDGCVTKIAFFAIKSIEVRC